MIDLINDPKPADRLNAICRNNNRDRNAWIAYAEGDYSSGIGNTPAGKAARALSDEGLVHLVQKLVSVEPRRYVYYAVTK